jgi:predicted RNase H-like nuclease (RuvC/YqgF family)
MTSLSIQYNSSISRSGQADNECPATPTSVSPSKTYQISPNKSPNKDSKHAKELKTLTTTVQALAQKLKKRDKQVRQMQEKADKLNEVALRLESTNKSIADAATENQTLSCRVSNLEANIKTQDVEESDRSKGIDKVEFQQIGQQTTIDQDSVGGGTTISRTVADTREHIHSLYQRSKVIEAASVIQTVTGHSSEPTVSEADSTIQDVASLSERMSNEKGIDEAEFRLLEIQRTIAVSTAEKKEAALAESRAESEKLRCQLVALTALLQHQNYDTFSIPESPRSISSPVNSMKLLSDFFKKAL